jgi:hypothetical protein
MADLKTLLKNARKDAQEAKTNVDNLNQVETNIEKLDQAGLDAIADFVENYPDGLTRGIDASQANIDRYTSLIQDTSIRLQQKVENAKTTLALMTKSKQGGYDDPTSKRMMLDYADEYKVSYVVVCAKAVIFVATLAVIYTPRNVFLTFATTAVVVLVWYTWAFLIEFFRNLHPKEVKLKDRKCPDGTPSNATGSNCKDTCPDTTANTFMSCEQSPFGCCPDGSTSPDAEMKGCPPPLACGSTEFGCCPDRLSERTDAEGSYCDWTYFRGDCSKTTYGCCPNGSIKEDADGSNCTLTSSCGLTAFGCCPNGDPRDDLAGSNCS